MTDTAPEAEPRTEAAEPRHKMQQHGNEHRQQFYETAKADEQPTPSPMEEPQRPSKLTFTADEVPPTPDGRKLTQARQKAERLEGKLERAEGRLPSYRKLRMESTSDPATGKTVKRLKFEKEVKPQSTHVKGSLSLRPVKAGANIAGGVIHRKVYQVEEENVGVKAAHWAEMVGEAGMRGAYRMHKTAPYRKVSRLQKKVSNANAKAAYQKALQDNPKLKKSLLSRMYQKQKLKRQYAKAAREAKRAGKAAKKTAVTTEKIATRVVLFVKRHPVAFGIIALILLIFFMITSMFSSCANMGAGGIGGFAASTYLANDHDLNNAELFYTEWETDLQMQINSAELIYPGYDEYQYDVDTIGHDPYVLMAYLTAAYQNFTYEGSKFRLYGTADCGLAVNEYAVVDSTGKAYFRDVLIGSGYVLEEVDTAVRYVIPDALTVNIEWNKVTETSVDNILKKWRAEVMKVDRDLYYGNEPGYGGEEPMLLSLKSDAIVEQYGYPYGVAQGDATLAGHTYGVFDGDRLVDTYVTDENGYFITDYYLIHIDVVFESAVLDPSLQLFPKVIAIIHCQTFNVCFDAIMLIGGKIRLHLSQCIQRCCENGMPFPVNDGNAITNEIIRGDIIGKKLDEDGFAICGALFGLFRESETVFTEDTALLTCESNEIGVFFFEDVPFGRWIVREIKAAPAFVLNENNYAVTVSEHEEVIDIVIENEFITGSVQLTKVDKEYPDNKLAGAIFEVYVDVDGDRVFNAEVDKFVGEMTEVETGVYRMDDLRYNGYFCYEKTAPEGFLKDENYHYFEIRNDGETVTVENEAGVGFVNQPITGELELTKKDISDGKLLANVGFRIRNEVGEIVAEGYTDENGIAKFTLRYGKYTYQEFDGLDGYIIDENEYAFEIKENGEIVKAEMTNEKIPQPDNPQTGDNSRLDLWVGLAAASLGALIVLAFGTKKKRTKTK